MAGHHVGVALDDDDAVLEGLEHQLRPMREAWRLRFALGGSAALAALVPLLQDHFASPRIPIYAVMLQERHRLPKIRACIDYWADWLTQRVSEPAGFAGILGSREAP